MTVLALEMTTRLEQRASPELIAYAELLALPAVELTQAIHDELLRNPALELVEQDVCPFCGEHLVGIHCFGCARGYRGQAEAPSGDTLAATQSPAEALLGDLQPFLEHRDADVLEHLVWSLDEHGLIDADPREIAGRLRVDADVVDRMLELLRLEGPPGIGARDVRESLLLQLERLDLDGETRALAESIVRDHLADLAAGRTRAIAHACGAAPEAVALAVDVIRSQLRPWAALEEPEHQRAASPALPDVIIRLDGDALLVDLVEPRRLNVVVAQSYADANLGSLESAERARVESQLASAHSFRRRLDQRWRTMRLIAEETVKRQREFVLHGARHLLPLTRAEVARSIGVHESTVSRAVADRHVLLPSRRVMPFSAFFDSAQAPCAALAELIAGETTPRSDTDLAEELAELGFEVARRTVAKYRGLLGIPPHTRR